MWADPPGIKLPLCNELGYVGGGMAGPCFGGTPG